MDNLDGKSLESLTPPTTPGSQPMDSMDSFQMPMRLGYSSLDPVPLFEDPLPMPVQPLRRESIHSRGSSISNPYPTLARRPRYMPLLMNHNRSISMPQYGNQFSQLGEEIARRVSTPMLGNSPALVPMNLHSPQMYSSSVFPQEAPMVYPPQQNPIGYPQENSAPYALIPAVNPMQQRMPHGMLPPSQENVNLFAQEPCPNYPHDSRQANTHSPHFYTSQANTTSSHFYPSQSNTHFYPSQANTHSPHYPSQANTHSPQLYPSSAYGSLPRSFMSLPRNFESSEPEGRFACSHPGCNRVFDRAHNLRSHSRCHLVEAPHTCTICNIGFKRATDLSRHTISKHAPESEKPWACCKCSKKFGRADMLKRHLTSTSKVHSCPAGDWDTEAVNVIMETARVLKKTLFSKSL